jgi:antitoxin component YwqK of YwqJK toxin-antitoxin module
MKHYRSSIPKAARERVTATFVNSPKKYKVECVLAGEPVGIRYFHETGELALECPMKNGSMHGIEYRSDVPGKLLSAEPYSNGLPHGNARQWSHTGKLLGAYTMKHGTGVDLWWQEGFENRPSYLAEARYYKAGKRHGFEWWLNEDQKSVWEESHFRSDERHGIERHWNSQGRLCRGYPKYWVNDARVTKRQYLRACAKDASLPPFREADNRPQRKFPPEVAAHLR